jgi:hypothetical protein
MLTVIIDFAIVIDIVSNYKATSNLNIIESIHFFLDHSKMLYRIK